MDDFADGQADGETGAALELDDLGAGGLGVVETFVLNGRIKAGPLFEGQAGDGGTGPDGDHAVAVFAEDQGVYLRGRHLEAAREITAEAGGVELGAKAEHALPGQAGIFD